VTPQNPQSASRLRRLLIGRNPKVTLLRAAILALACFLFFKFILLPVRVTGGSMLPAYRDGSVNFINRLAYRSHDPRRGDVVGIRFSGNSVMLLKRVVGLPGENVSFSGGRLLINGLPQGEPYLKWPCDWNRPPRLLGPDEFFVVGDNRTMPMQDHQFGAAERRRIVGRIVL
jgi:signal peptidase I